MKKLLLPFLLFCNVCTSFGNNCTSDSTVVEDFPFEISFGPNEPDFPISNGGKRSPVITPQVFHNQEFIAFRCHREISFSYYIYGVEEREILLSGSIILRARQTKRIPIHCLDEGSYMLTLQIGNLMLKGRFEKE